MKLLRDVLRTAGYETLEATTGLRAVELAIEHKPDIVLVDVQLPDISGVEALGHLRANRRTASTMIRRNSTMARSLAPRRSRVRSVIDPIDVHIAMSCIGMPRIPVKSSPFIACRS